MVPSVPEREAYEPDTPFPMGTRYLGDSMCWTIDLHPFSDINGDDDIRDIPVASGNIEANRWLVTLDQHRHALVNAKVFVSDRLEHGYAVSPSLSTVEIFRRMALLKAAFPDKRCDTLSSCPWRRTAIIMGILLQVSGR